MTPNLLPLRSSWLDWGFLPDSSTNSLKISPRGFLHDFPWTPANCLKDCSSVKFWNTPHEFPMSSSTGPAGFFTNFTKISQGFRVDPSGCFQSGHVRIPKRPPQGLVTNPEGILNYFFRNPSRSFKDSVRICFDIHRNSHMFFKHSLIRIPWKIFKDYFRISDLVSFRIPWCFLEDSFQILKDFSSILWGFRQNCAPNFKSTWKC